MTSKIEKVIEDPCKVILGNEILLPGWGCGHCHTYNGAHRTACGLCGHKYCGPAYEVVERQQGVTLKGSKVNAITKIRVIEGGEVN